MTDPAADAGRPTFVYDGHCVMCSAFARHVAARDPDGRIRLVASQSEEGRSRYASLGLDADAPTTNLFVDRDGHTLTHSDSSLAILREIGHSRVLIRTAALVPRPLRDAAYRLVARNRYRMFGRHETCQLFEEPALRDSLYRRAFGAGYDRLPEAVRELHAATSAMGEADVVRGPGLLPSLVSIAFGLPPTGRSVPLTVTFSRDGDAERWTRSFAGGRLCSRQELSARPGHLVESFGPIRVEVAALVEADGLTLRPVRAWLVGVPLPRRLVPGGYGRESARDGRYRFDVEVRALGRLIVSYGGHLSIHAG